jgi:general secretion pathway protein G
VWYKNRRGRRAEGGGRRPERDRLSRVGGSSPSITPLALPLSSALRPPPSELRPPPFGFTLLELLVVIAIIATLAAVVAPAVFSNVADAKVTAAKSQIDLLALALNSYRLDNDAYPATDQGLEALRTLPVGGEPPKRWRGPYLSRVVPFDPWGRPYVYLAPGSQNPATFDLYTLGRDGRTGGTDEDADITSWGGGVRQ